MKHIIEFSDAVVEPQHVQISHSKNNGRVAIHPHLKLAERSQPVKVLMAANVASFFKKFLLPYAEHFRDNGWQVDAMSKGFDEVGGVDWAKYFNRVHEVDWARKPHKLRGTRNIVHQIRSIAEEGKYDIIHVHTPVAAMVTRFALRNPMHRRHSQIIYTAHGFHFFSGASPFASSLYQKMETVASKWTDYLVVMNGEDLEAAKTLRMVPDDRLRFMPGIGIDLERFGCSTERSQRVRKETREQLGVKDSEVLFTCVAEFIARKRQHDILTALSRGLLPNVKVAFAGAGETLHAVKKYAEKLNLMDRAIFLGNRDDVPNLIQASDATILPSCQEGLPRSIMESLAGGVPVIATDVRGSRDLVEEGVGILYPVGNVDALAAAMAELASDSQKAREMGKREQKAFATTTSREL